MDERQAELRKRKRDDDSDASDSPLVGPEKPKADQDLHNPKTKKRKLADPEASSSQVTNPATQETEEQRIQRKKEEKAAKKRRKQEKKAKKQEKIDRHKARKKEEKQQQKKGKPSKDGRAQKSKPLTEPSATHQQSESGDSEMDDQEMAEPINIDGASAFIGGVPLADDDASSIHSQEENPEVFSPLHDSGISSSSSIQPPTSEDKPLEQSQNPTSESHTEAAASAKIEAHQAPQLRNSSHDEEEDPKHRLQAAITAFRAERKADTGPKSRTELLDQRRRQEERRRADKKEQKRRERDEAAQKQEEEIAKRFSPGGSGSLLGSPRSPIIEGDSNNFSFGRVAFADGSSLDQTASSAVEAHKKKGPSDPATAYKAAQAKQQRVSGYDADKRATIQEKDMWNNARKRASGEKVKDDTSLLKKALKRHEGQKKKSEKEWNERKEGIQKGIDLKQKKRTENLAKRKDEKGQKGKKGKVKRPGFEGSFRGRTGGGKKKA